jgi:DNA-binding beta-propeller fold protein YncE
VVLAGGRTILAASGSTIVPVDAVTRTVGTPLDLGTGRTIFGLAVDPVGTTVYALVPGGVVPVDTATAQAGAEIPTGLSVSSVYSPHGITVTADGSRVYVVGQSGTDFGGRVLPIDTATGATLPEASFDKFGIADPAAVAVTADGATLLVADAANNWVNLVQATAFAAPLLPAKLPEQGGSATTGGSQHPTDIVIGTGDTGAFVVDGFNSVIPFAPSSQVFGPPIRVCSGASSMAVAPAP